MDFQLPNTLKKLNFIDDVKLRDILLKRLNELDGVSSVKANDSTIFMAISTLEGILKHMAAIYN